MRTIAVVTVARSDYGIYLPILREIQKCPELSLRLLVSGMHLSPTYGLTLRVIEKDGFEISDRIEMLVSSDTPEGIAKSIGLGIIGFSQSFTCHRPDILVVLGDRFEMYAAAIAALPFNIPIAHIHGGELTEGAIDDSIRHCLTKLSHFHFVSMQEYANRVIQMGEEPWRVIISGAPGLDNIRSVNLLSRSEFNTKYTTQFDRPPLLVTYHPVTRELEDTEWQIDELLDALDQIDLPVIITMPNADTGNSVILKKTREYQRTHKSVYLLDNLGTEGYFSLMNLACAMVGNSSSGIIEAASFHLPVVNIGNRQKGRVRSENVIDVGYNKEEIINGIKKALSNDFLSQISQINNPYGNGYASGRIVATLKTVDLDHNVLIKKFYNCNK